MEHISATLPKVGVGSGLETRDDPRNTRTWGKFSEFKTLDDPSLLKMKVEAARFAYDMLKGRASPRWLSLLGTSGAGKTMLAKIIARLFRLYRHDTIDWNRSERTKTELRPYGQIIRRKGGFINWGNAVNNRMLKGDYDFLEDMRSYDFFAIDDILSEYEKHRALSASKLYNVLEARLGKWTVITANVGLQQIGEHLDPRIASRMLRNGGVVVDVEVVDYNLRKK